MSVQILRIATRRSPLAMWQAEHVRDALLAAHPDLQVELLEMSTQGDKILDTPLAKIGGKGLFVKELERAMLDGDADIAVHSMKDVPVDLPDGLYLPVILEREDPLDAFVSNNYADFSSLPDGAVVGTSSLRRQCQIREKRPDLDIRDLRGNVNTRLKKLDDGEYDAIVLASAGLKRLNMAERITAQLTDTVSLPAIGQGAIGIESRVGDTRVDDLIAVLNDTDTHTRVAAERALNARLGGGCQVPIAGFALLDNDEIWIRGLVGQVDGQKIIRAEARGPRTEAAALGTQVAESLLENGAEPILAALFNEADHS